MKRDYQDLVAPLDDVAAALDYRPPERVFPPLDDVGAMDAAQDLPAPMAPPVMSMDSFPPLVWDVVDAATRASEAHPVAVAVHFISLFCCAIGRNAFQHIGDATVHARPFFLVVGKSGKARKGTSEVTAREVARLADALLRKRNGSTDRLRIHDGGLSSGEGVAWAIRDPRAPDDNGKGADPGVRDKRLMVIESEFANLLAQTKREGNTLSAIVRNLFDGRTLEPMTKTNQVTASDPHVVVTGHITMHELREKSTENDAANGLLNRFLAVHVYRPKLVALPRKTDPAVMEALAARMAGAIDFATRGDPHGRNTLEVSLSAAASECWCELYPEISRDREGVTGSLMARSEVYARILAMVFALLDRRSTIEPGDILMAAQWVDYWRQSIDYIWRAGDEADDLDDFTKAVLRKVMEHPGIKLADIQEHWKRKRTAEVNASLETLANLAPPLVEMRRDASGGGRPAHRYYPVGGQ